MCSGAWPGVAIACTRKPAEIELVAVREAAVGKGQLRAGRAHDRCAEARELPAAGDEVRVQVGLERVAEHPPVSLGPTPERRDVAWRIDDGGAPVAEVDDVRGIAEARVLERGDLDHSYPHRDGVANQTMVRIPEWHETAPSRPP